MEEINLFSLSLKYFEIIDFFPGCISERGAPTHHASAKASGSVSRPFVTNVDYNGHFDLRVKSSEEEDTAIPRAINLTKISIIPVQKNYFG